MTEPGKQSWAETAEDKEQDEDLRRKEKKNKARHRSRGPYRKAHVHW